MQLIPLACNHCSAPLQVPELAKFVTCTHCNSQLAVRRNSGLAYTERLEDIDRRTQELAEQVARLNYQEALRGIDAEWERERERLLITDKHGRRREPSEFGAILAGVIFGVIGMTVLGMGSIMGLLILVMGGIAVMISWNKSQEFRAARARYRRRRASLGPPGTQPETAEQFLAGLSDVQTPRQFLAELQTRHPTDRA